MERRKMKQQCIMLLAVDGGCLGLLEDENGSSLEQGKSSPT
jgi:hypothetical protein